MNKRKRERKIRQITETKRKLKLDAVREKPATASKYLHSLKEYHEIFPDIEVIIYIRVSTNAQGCKRNLDTYEKVLRRKLKKLNIPVLGCYREIGSGWVLNKERRSLINAAKKAKELNAVIVAPSADRFLRNRNYTYNEPDLLPTQSEYEELKKLTCEIPLLTLLHPDMPPKIVRGLQSKWGQKAKGNKGGRPRKNMHGYKKERRFKEMPHVLRLHQSGATLAEIKASTGIPRSTVRLWIENNKKKGV